jgi:hypothetical protein
MFLKLMFFLCCKNFVKIGVSSNTFRVNAIIHNKKSSGYDERNNTEKKNTTQMSNIHEFFAKKKILDILKDDNVSLYTKVILVKDNSVKPYNLFAGGLMNDFDFPDF